MESLKAQLRELDVQRQYMEEEIMARSERLTAPGMPGLKGPLVDAEVLLTPALSCPCTVPPPFPPSSFVLLPPLWSSCLPPSFCCLSFSSLTVPDLCLVPVPRRALHAARGVQA